jgi:hypothetical protein
VTTDVYASSQRGSRRPDFRKPAHVRGTENAKLFYQLKYLEFKGGGHVGHGVSALQD